MESLRTTREGILVDVHVVPNSRTESVQYSEGVLKVKVKSPADKGKANKDVLKALSRLFGPAKIIRGLTSRRKTALIPGSSTEKVAEILKSLNESR